MAENLGAMVVREASVTVCQSTNHRNCLSSAVRVLCLVVVCILSPQLMRGDARGGGEKKQSY